MIKMIIRFAFTKNQSLLSLYRDYQNYDYLGGENNI